MSPPIIITDFEQAVINATKSEFSDFIHKGCFFHFYQNLWRKIQSEGLASEYGNNEDFSIKLRHLTALTFLPPSEIPTAFDQVKLLLPENAAGIAEYLITIMYVKELGKQKIDLHVMHLHYSHQIYGQ